MSGTFKPTSSNVENLLKELKRVPFVIEDTFTFKDYDPQVTGVALTVTGTKVRHCRYLKIWKFVWLSFYFQTTMSAGAGVEIDMVLPEGLIGAGNFDSFATYTTQKAAVYNNGDATNGIGEAELFAEEGKIRIYTLTRASYVTPGTASIGGNLFFEVK